MERRFWLGVLLDVSASRGCFIREQGSDVLIFGMHHFLECFQIEPEGPAIDSFHTCFGIDVVRVDVLESSCHSSSIRSGPSKKSPLCHPDELHLVARDANPCRKPIRQRRTNSCFVETHSDVSGKMVHENPVN